MYAQDRARMRQFIFEAWRKAVAGRPLEPLERQIAEVVARHPEYHPLLEDAEGAQTREFRPESGEDNPFLHLGLHIAILEQVATDLPPGIRDAYRRIAAHTGDAHEAEHRIMDCLAAALWEAQRNGQPANEAAYIGCVQGLARVSRGTR
jgi:hypothetical protein